MRFWLGVHEPGWLAHTDVGLMVSHRRLQRRGQRPRARGPWVCDSGGFTELSLHGRWRQSPEQYADAVNEYAERIGRLVWAAPQDWMNEPTVRARTGLTVAEHQRRTTENYLELRERGPFVPVLQGWELRDYLAHVEQYDAAGVDLTTVLVGVGSICRRGSIRPVVEIVEHLSALGLRLHAFGANRLTLAACGDLLASSDSLAWSYRARRAEPLPGCTHASCSNCLTFALDWRRTTIARAASAPLRLWSLP